jgi:hypothetical protein
VLWHPCPRESHWSHAASLDQGSTPNKYRLRVTSQTRVNRLVGAALDSNRPGGPRIPWEERSAAGNFAAVAEVSQPLVFRRGGGLTETESQIRYSEAVL